MPNLTVNIDPELLRQAKVYASQHGTTLSDLVRKNFLEITKSDRSIIERYVDGGISSADAQQALGLRTKQDFFAEVCRSGHQLYHLKREKAEQLANAAIALIGG